MQCASPGFRAGAAAGRTGNLNGSTARGMEITPGSAGDLVLKVRYLGRTAEGTGSSEGDDVSSGQCQRPLGGRRAAGIGSARSINRCSGE
jgi:hypothetical protein